MSKREASHLAAAGVDIDAPRAKRRKEATAPGEEHTTSADKTANGKSDATAAGAVKEDPEAVKEKGTRLWQVVKDAVNKEGRTLSVDFLRLPSKRQYPDYYLQIKRPIALDDIKSQLDAGAYTSLEDIKQDFETCFRNAKRYNIRESQIWKDAKHLHKLATKEYAKMTGTTEDAAEDGEDGPGSGGGGGGFEDEGGKKKKVPNMNRLLKTRLQKLVEKTDDDGRVLSVEFLELPNRKQWPIYYKMIKRPQCIEAIFKHLKRKEYHTATDFANDVELVFSNALEFNQEHTPIWEDAVVLRNTFRQLMSDLPAPFLIPAYAPGAEVHPKIRLKMPAASSSTSVPTAQTATAPTPIAASSSTGVLRLHPHHAPPTKGLAEAAGSPTIPPKVSTPLASAASPPNQPMSSAPAHAPLHVKPKVPAPSLGAGTLQPATFSQPSPYPSAYSTHYPNATYHQPSAPSLSAVASTSSVPSTTAVTPALAATSQPVAPSIPQNNRQLKCVCLTTKPLGRRFDLDYAEGVKTWAVRLGFRETAVYVSGVRLLPRGEEEEESSDDERKDVEMEEEEEEEEEPKVKRGRGRPRKKAPKTDTTPPKVADTAKSKAKGKAPAKPARPHEECEVRLGGLPVSEIAEQKDEWDVDLTVGSNVLEVGVKGGMVWKVYLERVI
ncbi:Bromodomain-containing protein [Sparassis latifolia]|uniref:Protein polybromo-1 n=1 Tax=Sparassis crispa TaxID=139825 RepID=A0A401G5X5_9APHY|nr:Protein polybromo-1 [Sparassis crispa]GBE77565.1 Protein polybromo-1 [Sparassis crispa]